jgi:hypothetical protein
MGKKKGKAEISDGIDVANEANEEVFVLENIFGGDFARQDAGGNERHRFSLTVSDKENQCVVRMNVGLPTNYPLHAPRVSLELVRGLSDDMFSQVQASMRKAVSEHSGCGAACARLASPRRPHWPRWSRWARWACWAASMASSLASPDRLSVWGRGRALPASVPLRNCATVCPRPLRPQCL